MSSRRDEGKVDEPEEATTPDHEHDSALRPSTDGSSIAHPSATDVTRCDSTSFSVPTEYATTQIHSNASEDEITAEPGIEMELEAESENVEDSFSLRSSTSDVSQRLEIDSMLFDVSGQPNLVDPVPSPVYESVDDLLGNIPPSAVPLNASLPQLKIELGVLMEVSEEEFDGSPEEPVQTPDCKSAECRFRSQASASFSSSMRINTEPSPYSAANQASETPRDVERLIETAPQTPLPRVSTSCFIIPTRISRADDGGISSRRLRLSIQDTTRKKASIFCARLDDPDSAEDTSKEVENQDSLEDMYSFNEGTVHRTSENSEIDFQRALEVGLSFLLQCSVLGHDGVPNCDGIFNTMVHICESEGTSRQSVVDTFIEHPELELDSDALNIMSSRVPLLGICTVASIWSAFRSSALIAALFSHPLSDTDTQIKVVNSIGPVRALQDSIEKEIAVLAEEILLKGDDLDTNIQVQLCRYPPLPKANVHFQPKDNQLSLYVFCTFISDRGFFFLPSVAAVLNLAIMLYSYWPPVIYGIVLLIWSLREKLHYLIDPNEKMRLRAEAVLLYHSSLPMFVALDTTYLFCSGITEFNAPNILLSVLCPWAFWCGRSRRPSHREISAGSFQFTHTEMFQIFQVAMAVALLLEVISPRNFFMTVPFVICKIVSLWGEQNLFYKLLRPEVALECLGAKDSVLMELNLEIFRGVPRRVRLSAPARTFLNNITPRPFVQYLVFTMQELALPVGVLLGVASCCPSTPARILCMIAGACMATYVVGWHHQILLATTAPIQLERLLLLLPKQPEQPDQLNDLLAALVRSGKSAYRRVVPYAKKMRSQEFSFGLQASDW